ncbi:transmembrane protein, putative [Medicago truncatula]|uniref:Transmembrane protein, putative n=1 Tax=Medicago truncatula TaxID=3880 RepID=A0A072UD14_MEDTR|nr:transmembrane protein, putative [Medicago truncatula]
MALMREKSINKLINANIFTIIVMQFVLTFVLFSQVTYAWNWRCLGARNISITFEADNIEADLRCHGLGDWKNSMVKS